MLAPLIAAALLASVGLVSAQANGPYCDSTTGICFQGYTDPELNITVGLVLPPLQPTGSSTPNATEYIVQLVASVSYGWTGVSLGGTMADSLLFTLWPYDNAIMLGPRWTSGYTLPTAYAGPIVTVLHSVVNSTYISATWRCQNCTTWEDGSLGSGDLTAFQLLAYAASTVTPVDDPAEINSTLEEHNQFDFFGMDLSSAHSADYSSYINIGKPSSSSVASTTTSSKSSSTSTKSSTTTSSTSKPISTSTSTAAVPTATKYGQCGGTGYTGPTVCATGIT